MSLLERARSRSRLPIRYFANTDAELQAMLNEFTQEMTTLNAPTLECLETTACVCLRYNQAAGNPPIQFRDTTTVAWHIPTSFRAWPLFYEINYVFTTYAVTDQARLIQAGLIHKFEVSERHLLEPYSATVSCQEGEIPEPEIRPGRYDLTVGGASLDKVALMLCPASLNQFTPSSILDFFWFQYNTTGYSANDEGIQYTVTAETALVNTLAKALQLAGRFNP